MKRLDRSRVLTAAVVRHLVLGFCLIVAICLGIGTFRIREAGENAPETVRPVRTVTLEGGGAEGVKQYFGTVQGARRAALSFRVSGPLKTIRVEKGASVKKGDLLATLDPRDFQTALKQAQSAQAQAQAQYEDASANFKRYDNLYKQKIVAASTHDTYKTRLDVSRSALKAAQAQTAAARDALNDTELRAPFDGVIADRNVENFQDVTARQTILSLQDISTLEIVFSIPVNDVLLAPLPASLDLKDLAKRSEALGLTAQFEAIPSRTFPAKLKEFGAQADTRTNTYPVTVTMPHQSDVRILPGMAATVTVDFTGAAGNGGSSAGYYVPATAILTGEGDVCLWRFADGVVSRVPVTVGGLRGDGAVMVSGPDLREGDCIVTAGVHFLREGQRVRLIEEVGQ